MSPAYRISAFEQVSGLHDAGQRLGGRRWESVGKFGRDGAIARENWQNELLLELDDNEQRRHEEHVQEMRIGEISLPTLGSVLRVEGSIASHTLILRTTEHIKRGVAVMAVRTAMKVV